MRTWAASLLVASSVLGCTAVRPSSGDETERSGLITFASSPGSTVFVGADRLGETPVAGIELPVGEHEVRFVSEAAELEKTITIQTEPKRVARYLIELWDDTLRCERDEDPEQRDRGRFESDPPAEVHIDGQHIGTTPVAMPIAAPGASIRFRPFEVRLFEPKSRRSKTFSQSIGDGFVCRARF